MREGSDDRRPARTGWPRSISRSTPCGATAARRAQGGPAWQTRCAAARTASSAPGGRVEEGAHDLIRAPLPVPGGVGDEQTPVPALKSVHCGRSAGVRLAAGAPRRPSRTEPAARHGGVVRQPLRLGVQERGALLGEPVVPAQPPVDDLLPVGRHEALVAEPVEGAVKGTGPEGDPAGRQPVDLLDHSVPVQRLAGQGGQDQEGRLLEGTRHGRLCYGYRYITSNASLGCLGRYLSIIG